MKIICTFILSLMSAALLAQDTLYFDSDDKQVETFAQAKYMKIICQNSTDENRFKVFNHFQNGEKEEVNYIVRNKKKISDGRYIKWYPNGQVQQIRNYSQSKLNKNFLMYWYNGQLKRHDIYRNDTLLVSQCWNRDGKEVECKADVMPSFPGGNQAFREYLSKKMRYPFDAQRDGIEGRVVVQFVVQRDGSLSNFKFLEKVHYRLDDEAMRLVKSMPKWNPGMIDGEPVSVRFALPVLFRLPPPQEE